jgi:hypothetical protein
LSGGVLRQLASVVSIGFERVRVVADFRRRYRRLPVAQLVAQHLLYLLKDALAPSKALEIALSQSAPEDRLIIRHFSRDGTHLAADVVGIRVVRPNSINLSVGCEVRVLARGALSRSIDDQFFFQSSTDPRAASLQAH